MLLILSTVLVLAGARMQTPADERRQALLERVRDEGDDVEWKTLYDLARPGDAGSFEALLTTIDWLHRPAALQGAFYAFWYFRADPELSKRALEFLADQAVEAGNREVRAAAVFPLSYFGAGANAAFERVLRASQDDEVCERAMGHALGHMLTRGDEQALELVLRYASASAIERGEQRFKAFDPDLARPHFLARLKQAKASVGWILVLVAELAADPGEDLVEILRNLLRHRSSVVQLAAIRALVARGEAAQARAQLERMRLASEPHVKVEVVRILTRLAAGDPAWTEKLLVLARSSNAHDRIAAAVSLGDLGDAPALARLVELFDDRSWKVRDAAFAVARELRRKELLPGLIARLDQESGVQQLELVATLEHLTGLQLGRSAGAWRRWYDEHGATTELPSEAAVLALEAERAAPRADASVAQFYGLPVRSKNVAFLLDASGSMRERAAPDGDEERTSAGELRIDVARRELTTLLARMSDDSRCNLLFFSDEIEPWEDRLRRLDAKGRASALAFVAALEIGGGTDIHGALLAGFEDDDTDTLYLLSDGDPSVGKLTDPLEIRAEVAQWNSVARVTIHCISVGQSSRLLADLARDSGGQYLEVGLPSEPAREPK